MRLAIVIVAVLTLVACNRHVAAPGPRPLTETCPIDLAPPAPEMYDGPLHSLSIALADASSGTRIDSTAYAGATLQYPGGRRVSVRRPASLRFDSLAAGRYVLRVVRIGYNARVDTIAIGSNVGRGLSLRMTRAPLDGCGGFAVVVPAQCPWWKFW